MFVPILQIHAHHASLAQAPAFVVLFDDLRGKYTISCAILSPYRDDGRWCPIRYGVAYGNSTHLWGRRAVSRIFPHLAQSIILIDVRTVLEHVKLVRIPHRRCGIFSPHPLSLTFEALFPQATRRGRTGDELTDDARDDEKAEVRRRLPRLAFSFR